MAVIAALVAIFVFSWWIRAINNQPDRILSFDPTFQYRFTRYFAEHGVLPAWDELSYYTGRVVTSYSPLMFYMTAAMWWVLSGFGWSLLTTASWAGAIYGAAIIVPAFLLGRSLSNKWGGLLSAILVGAAPQILTRTFGASFDTDQLALFFILLSLWAGAVALKKRTPTNFFLLAGCFIAFAVAWTAYWFTFAILAVTVAIYGASAFLQKQAPSHQRYSIAHAFGQTKWMVGMLALLAVVIVAAGYFLGSDPLYLFFGLMGFAQHAETWIVNISIAELQSVDMASYSTWIMALGRIATNDALIDGILLLTLLSFLVAGLYGAWKRDKLEFALLTAIIFISIYSVTKGIRFTEFSSALMLVGVGIGWGHLLEWTRKRFQNPDTLQENFPLVAVTGIGLLLALTVASLGLQFAQLVGPDNSPNWDAAWTFLRSTPENSLVGTWWDPGHMITGLAERRVIADGAHCGNDCLYTINDRITDLGKVFHTSSEDEAAQILEKYKGTSQQVYWIASNDLISKFQWLQYFGTGCDARTDAKCALFTQLGIQSGKYTSDGTGIILNYGTVQIFQQSGRNFVPVIVQGRNAYPLSEAIMNGKGTAVNQSDIDDVRSVVTSENLRLVNQTVPYSVWMQSDAQYIVLIPSTLRNSLFVRMFFFEGQGLQRFKQVFSNPEVKIYEMKF